MGRTTGKNHLSDESIIRLYWTRQESAITETDKKYRGYIFVIANNILNDDYDSEECINDTYMGVWNRIPPTRPRVFPAFIAKITRNLAVGIFRRRDAQKRVPSELTVSIDELADSLSYSSDGEEAVEARELGRLISEYLRTLGDRDEYEFVCRYYYFDKIADIAAALGLSVVTIRTDLKRIRDGLKAYLERGGFSV